MHGDCVTLEDAGCLHGPFAACASMQGCRALGSMYGVVGRLCYSVQRRGEGLWLYFGLVAWTGSRQVEAWSSTGLRCNGSGWYGCAHVLPRKGGDIAASG